MARSVVEQERELKDLIRRGRGNSDKTGTLRRDILKQLIEFTQAAQPSLKILAAEGIQYFFRDFPELEEASINAVYDLCEDQSSTVRIEGYKALAQLSRAQTKWVKRNADVLLQLLQSDEPEEVVVVKQALLEHLDLDPRVTFGVLIDQIVPPEDAIDEEEQSIRDRLRGLVLSFLTDEAKQAVERRATPGSDAEEVLHSGLLTAIPKLGNNDVEKIVKEVLLSLPSYKSQSSCGQALLQILLDRASESLRVAMRASGKIVSLDSTRFYLDLTHLVAVHRKAAPATDLLLFYLTSLTSKITLQRLSKDDQIYVISHMADSLLASGHADPRLVSEERVTKVQRQAIDACPILFERLVENAVSDALTRGACITLLTECARRKKDTSWNIPPHFLSAFEHIRTSPLCNNDSQQARHIQSLIRSIAPTIAPPSQDQPTQANGTHLKAAVKLTKLATSPSSVPEWAPQGLISPAISIKRRTRDDSITTGSITQASSSKLIMTTSPRQQQVSGGPVDEHTRPSKRLKRGGNEDEEIPSLLSRMGNTSLSAAASREPSNPMVAPMQQKPKSQVASRPTASTTPVKSGLSIKGAASRDDDPNANARTSRHPSLLNRLGNGSAPVAGDNRGSRLGKRKGIA